MREKADETQSFVVRMPSEDYEKLRQLAEAEHRPLSEIVRMALQGYMLAAGVETKMKVTRGGNRRQPKE